MVQPLKRSSGLLAQQVGPLAIPATAKRVWRGYLRNTWVRMSRLLGMSFGLVLFVMVLDLSRLGLNPELAQAGNSWLKIGSLSVAGMISVAHSQGAVRLDTLKRLFLLWLYTAFALLSVFWSVDPSATAVGVAGLCGCLAMATAVVNMPLSEVLRNVRRVCDIVVVLSVAHYLVDPDAAMVYLQGMNRLAGITFGPHALARCAVVSLLIRMDSALREGGLRRNWLLTLPWFILYAGVIILASSRQSYLALPIGLGILLAPRNRQRLRLYVLSIVSVIIAAAVIIRASNIDVFTTVSALVARDPGENVTDLTGRTAIWSAARGLIAEEPILGYGFNAGGVALSSTYSTPFGWTTESAHNMVMHALLDVGFLGAAMLVITIPIALFRKFRSGERIEVAIIAVITAIGVVERSIAGAAGFLFLLYAVFCGRGPVTVVAAHRSRTSETRYVG